ncbi:MULTISPECIES: polysaccharide deacetylase family protein [Nostocales]|uniref:Polysaccharide deacetylase n=3 Tax=Nostocales TaxID=1161 RepID=A0A0C1R598_9CYAN|nr:polysaccharide deacetylase family protein [Tolypothrix bouteillei]KAF3889021.1 polysaccharide deacetylase family protein [Tolypothrix bouteillei VB521301]
MESNKSYVWSQGIFIALVALCGSFSLGLMMPINPNASKAQIEQPVNLKEIAASTGNQQRVEKFKTAMITTWQQEASIKGLSYAIPSRFQGVTIKSANQITGEKAIALTFDDGPWSGGTVQILDILKKNNIKATFFVVGQMLKEHPELARRIVAEGHIIGNHTWHHWYHQFSPQAAAYEIETTSDLIYKTTGVKTTLFRPPGGMMHNGLVNYAKNQKYTVVMWSADSVDYSRPAVPRLVRNVMKDSKSGGIVLMHDGGGNRTKTIQALPQIINNFKERGYRFVTVPELLEMEDNGIKLAEAKKGTVTAVKKNKRSANSDR